MFILITAVIIFSFFGQCDVVQLSSNLLLVGVLLAPPPAPRAVHGDGLAGGGGAAGRAVVADQVGDELHGLEPLQYSTVQYSTV